VEAFKDEFVKQATALFGSGWTCWQGRQGELHPQLCQWRQPREGRPEAILGFDVWEHAYYLDTRTVAPTISRRCGTL
jgi:Fe-Mn family superoxide dismutase